MDEKIKTWPLRFSAKENFNMEKALFDWPIVSQYDVKAKYRLISRKFFGHEVFSAERSLNQPKATRVCIRSINQSNRSISVRLLFLFCLRVFISRSYENRSIQNREVSCENNFRGMWVLFSILFKIMLEGNRKLAKLNLMVMKITYPINLPSMFSISFWNWV